VAWLLERKGLVIAPMTDSEQSENLFARELVQVLAEHGLKLERLAELVDIQPATIQRLQKSLNNPRFSPVLSPDELELLETTLLLNATEQGRLQAALLATALKRLLKDQLGLASARQITEQIYPDLLNAFLHADLRTQREEKRGQDHDSNEDTEADITWAVIWEAMDAANLAMQLSRGLSSTTEKIRKVQEARLHLDEALGELESLDGAIKSLPIWQTWYQKAKSDHKAVVRRLRALGKKGENMRQQP
jgi:hypothetical protein